MCSRTDFSLSDISSRVCTATPTYAVNTALCTKSQAASAGGKAAAALFALAMGCMLTATIFRKFEQTILKTICGGFPAPPHPRLLQAAFLSAGSRTTGMPAPPVLLSFALSLHLAACVCAWSTVGGNVAAVSTYINSLTDASWLYASSFIATSGVWLAAVALFFAATSAALDIASACCMAKPLTSSPPPPAATGA